MLTNSSHPILSGGEAVLRMIAETLIARVNEVLVLTPRRVQESPRLERVGNTPVQGAGRPAFKRFGKHFAVSSDSQAMPISLTEAMTCGLPMPVMPAGGSVNVVGDND